MGNRSETSTIIQNQEFTIQHSKINKAVFKKTKDHEFFQVTFPIQNSKQYQVWKDNLKNNPVSQFQFIFHPIKHEYKKIGMCGNSGIITARYDNYPFILSEEIKNKQNQQEKKKFADYQIWYLLYYLTKIGNQFHKIGQKIGDIRPKNIFINQTGKIKIATKYSWPKQISNFQKYFFDKQKTYLSPQEVKEVQIGRSQPNSNPILAQTFSIGLTILDTILLQNSQYLYNNQIFDEQRLQAKRQNLKNQPNYSDLLKYITLSMIQPNPKNRITTEIIYNWLKPFKKNILLLQPFTTNDIPQKVKQIINKNPIIKRNIQQVKDKVFIEKYQSYPTTMTSPINKFTTQNKQQSIILTTQLKKNNIEQKLRHSLQAINQKIATSKKMFPSQ